MKPHTRPNLPPFFFALLCVLTHLPSAFADPGTAQFLCDQSGVQGGLVVHVGCGDGTLTAGLRLNDGFLVQGLETDSARLAEAKQTIQTQGLYGPVSISSWDGKRLPFADHIVNLIVDEQGTVDLEDAQRVLAPRGVLMTKAKGKPDSWQKTFVQPVPGNIDEWTHYLHGPANTNVARDSAIGPPRRIKWTAGPEMLRHHDHLNSLNAIVSSEGRLFYIYDEAPSTSIMLPSEWKLIARDAFSGVLLWKTDVPEWHPHLWPLKSMPATLPRRLVSVGNDVFVTLGIEAPVSHLNAADGSLVKKFAGSERCEEILVLNDLVFALCLTGEGPLDDTDKEEDRLLDGRVTKFPLARRLASGVMSPKWLNADRRLIAYDRATGEERWHYDGKFAPLTLAADGEQVYFHNSDKIVALNTEDGTPVWTSEDVPIWQEHHSWFGASLVIHDDVVLFAGGENMTWYKGGTPKGATDSMSAFSVVDGRKLWAAAHPPSGYRSPEDLMVVQGLVWSPDSTHKSKSILKGHDPRTGEVVREFEVDYEHGFHHRCYPGKATENFLLISKVGVNLVDVREESVDNNQWVRGSCGIGFLPANGVIYTTPDPCNCYPESKLNGFAALATDNRNIDDTAPPQEALTKGPAYGTISATTTDWPAADWPIYRRDAARSGASTSSIPLKPSQTWEVEVGDRITAPVIAGGKVFLADIDAHRVEARDTESGKLVWQATAGSRVDSPPAVIPCGDDALCVFGSADGTVSCLRASDGEMVWRRRLAPLDERIVSKNGVESVWPIHGSVLYHQGLIHAVAGRSAFVDDGLFFYSLDPLTGDVVTERNRGPGDQTISGMNTETASTDILSADGDHLFMRSLALDTQFEPAEFHKGGHIFASNGFLDDSWFHRAFWVHGTSFSGGCGGFAKTGNANLSGRIMVSDGDHLFAFGRTKYGWGSAFEYKLYAAPSRTSTTSDPAADAKERRRNAKSKTSKPESVWAVDSPILVRAMVKAGDHLVIAGPKRLYDELTTIQEMGTPDTQSQIHAQREALEQGAELHVVSSNDGTFVSKVNLTSQPVWDGIAVAGGALYISGTDGKLRRWN